MSGQPQARIKALCLTLDRHRAIMDWVRLCYRTLWPDHPFVFHIPYQRDPPPDPGPDRVAWIRAPEPIPDTMERLLDGIPDDEWVWWCLDDKYPLTLDPAGLARLVGGLSAIHDPRVAGILPAWNRYTLRGSWLGARSFGGILCRRKDTYHGFYQPHFIRAGVLRHYMLHPERMEAGYVDRNRLKGLMPTVDAAAMRPLPRDVRVYASWRSLLTFGESLVMGGLSPNLVQAMQARGYPLPALPHAREGWYTDRRGRIVKTP